MPGFYTSHAAPYAYKMQTLYQLAGSDTKQMFHFRADLKDALERVAKVTGWSFSIDDKDLVHIKKSPSPSQARHLAKAKPPQNP